MAEPLLIVHKKIILNSPGFLAIGITANTRPKSGVSNLIQTLSSLVMHARKNIDKIVIAVLLADTGKVTRLKVLLPCIISISL